MKRLWLMIGLLAVGGIITAIAANPPGVSVTITPAKIFRHRFDLKHPPSEMPKLTPPEVGVCRFVFDCAMESHVEAEETAAGSIVGKFTEIRLNTSLTIHLWIPLNTPPKITAHEEAHREICERYYKLAENVARRLGQQALATPVSLASLNPESLKTAVRKMQAPIIAQFMRETAQRCGYAQERFDAITHHSLNPIAEPTAIDQALTEEALHHRARKNL